MSAPSSLGQGKSLISWSPLTAYIELHRISTVRYSPPLSAHDVVRTGSDRRSDYPVVQRDVLSHSVATDYAPLDDHGHSLSEDGSVGGCRSVDIVMLEKEHGHICTCSIIFSCLQYPSSTASPNQVIISCSVNA